MHGLDQVGSLAQFGTQGFEMYIDRPFAPPMGLLATTAPQLLAIINITRLPGDGPEQAEFEGRQTERPPVHPRFMPPQVHLQAFDRQPQIGPFRTVGSKLEQRLELRPVPILLIQRSPIQDQHIGEEIPHLRHAAAGIFSRFHTVARFSQICRQLEQQRVGNADYQESRCLARQAGLRIRNLFSHRHPAPHMSNALPVFTRRNAR